MMESAASRVKWSKYGAAPDLGSTDVTATTAIFGALLPAAQRDANRS
jgi:hypothetical protein